MELNQVCVAVRNLDEGVAFYRKIGLTLIVLDQESLYARFEHSSGGATFSIWQDRTLPPGRATLYFEVADVDQRHADLTAAGVDFDTPPTDQDWLWREAYFSDPSGNRLCLYHAGQNRRFPPWRRKDAARA